MLLVLLKNGSAEIYNLRQPENPHVTMEIGSSKVKFTVGILDGLYIKGLTKD